MRINDIIKDFYFMFILFYIKAMIFDIKIGNFLFSEWNFFFRLLCDKFRSIYKVIALAQPNYPVKPL